MTSHTLPSFGEAYYRLPDYIRQAARKAFFLRNRVPDTLIDPRLQ